MKVSLNKIVFLTSLIFATFIMVGCSSGASENKIIVSSDDQVSENISSSSSEHIHNFKLIDKVEATCLKEGCEIYRCSCEESYENNLGFADHLFDDWEIINHPTYDSEGLEERICSICETNETRTVPCLTGGETDIPEEHDHLFAYELNDEATHIVYCDYENCSYYVEALHEETMDEFGTSCYLCGYVIHEHDISQRGYSDEYGHADMCKYCEEKYNYSEHNYETEVIEYARCGEYEGLMEFKCLECGFSKKEPYVGTHNYSTPVPYDDYQHGYKCYCGDVINYENHSFDSEEYVTYPSYEHDGLVNDICSICEKKVERIISSSEHKCDFELIETVEPNCQREGYYVYQCSDTHCKYSYQEAGSPIVDHKYIEEVTKQPTCTLDGIKLVTCGFDCGYSKTITISKNGHSYEKGMCKVCERREILDYLTYQLVDETYVITSISDEYFTKLSDSNEIKFPDEIDGINVTKVLIDLYSFTASSISNKDLYFGDSVKEIRFRPYSFGVTLVYTGSMYLPSSLEKMSSTIFGEQDQASIYYDGNIYDWLKVEIASTSALPETSHFFVKNDFDDYQEIETVHLDSRVSKIQDYAFYGMSSLKSLIVDDSVTDIGKYIIQKCVNLETLEINTLDDIANYTLTNVKRVVVYNGNDIYVNDFPNIEYLEVRNCSGNVFAMGCSSLTTVKLPSNLGSIMSSAFRNCSSLESIDIANSVTVIGDYAFSGCKSIKEINLPSSLITIGQRAFEGCELITSIEIPSTVKTIGVLAFYKCSSLEKINLPSSITSLGDDILAYTKVKELTYGLTNSLADTELSSLGLSSYIETIHLDGVSKIPDNFLKNVTSVKTITTNCPITSIGDYAFFGCTLLTNFPECDRLTYLGISAFENCSNLSEIYFSFVDEHTMRERVFANCSSLETVEISDLSTYAFFGCTSLINLNIRDTSYIPENCFYNCTSLIKLDFVNGVIIDKYAFYGTNFSSLEFTGEVDIKEYAFASLRNPISLTINNKSTLDRYAFYSTNILNLVCDGETTNISFLKPSEEIHILGSALTSDLYGDASVLTFSSTLNSISSNLTSLSNVTTLVIPQKVTSINGYLPANLKELTLYKEYIIRNLFEKLPPLEKVNMIDCSTIINSQFSNLSSLVEITSNVLVTSVGKYAFLGCTSLISLPSFEKVESFGLNAFKDCSSLEKIVFNSNSYTIDSSTIEGSNTFEGCTSLVELVFTTLPTNNTIETIFYPLRMQIEKITITNETSIPNYTFRNCFGLKEVYLNEGITSIGTLAFDHCGIQSITIPSTVLTVGQDAFMYCDALQSVTLKNGLKVIDVGSFSYCTSLSTLEIPASVEEINLNAFYRCDSLYQVRNLSSVEFTTSNAPLHMVNEIKDKQTPYQEVKIIGDFEYLYSISKQMNTIVKYNGNSSTITFPTLIENSKYSIHQYSIPSCESIYLNEGIYDFDRYIIENYDNLKYVYLYQKWDNDNYIAESLDSVQKLELGEGYIIVEKSDFEKFNYVNTLILSDKLTSFDSTAFTNSYKIAEVINPTSLDLGLDYLRNEYASKSSYTSQIYEDGLLIYVYDISEGKYFLLEVNNEYNDEVVIPSTFNNKEVVIGKGSIDGEIKTLVVSEGIKTIEDCGIYITGGSATLPTTLINLYSDSIIFDNVYNIYLPKLSINYPVGSVSINYSNNLYFAGTVSEYLDLFYQDGFNLNSNGAHNLYFMSSQGYELGTEIEISTAYTYVPDNAFIYVDSLVSVTLDSKITEIGNYAFEYCQNLTSINLDNIKIIGSYSFNYSGIANVNTDNLISIGERAFCGCYGITEISLPKIETIGTEAFTACVNIETITLGENLTSVGSGAFSACYHLKEITIPSKVTSLEDGLFMHNELLNKIYILGNIDTIGKDVFKTTRNTNSTIYIYYSGTESDLNSAAGSNINWKLLNSNTVTHVTVIENYSSAS